MNAYAKLGDIEMAQDLFDQMIGGGGHDVPKMTPNLVTYNTLLDACHKSGELDIAIHVKEQLDYTELSPDTRTYTTLIASVARKATAASGANDPTLAFLFLQEMKSLNIKPNGMTYSALIDVCGRCQRSDLALKGLRLMLDQKAQEQKRLEISTQRGYTLSNEVGAWTAAIDACGKAGRIDTALKLFYTMPNFGVNPNTITCGSLVDCLLRNGRTADSLKVLRYMKKHHIAPSEVMYTSLMTSASRLAEFENQKLNESSPPKKIEENKVPLLPVGLSDDHGATKAVEVYTELMASLSQVPRAGLSKSSGDSNELFRVALVFQEMKAAGVEPDLACYNALLKSCANIGDADRAREVLNQICASDEVEPNEQTWNAVIRAAGKAGRSDVALATWQSAVDDALKGREDSRPLRSKSLSDRSFASLLSALVRSAEDKNIDRHTKVRLYQLVVKIYAAVNSQSQFLGMDMVNKEKIVQNMLIMGTILQAVVSLEKFVKSEGETITMGASQLRRLAVSIVQLDCFKDGLTFLQRNAAISAAHKIASSWSY
jgi:pentatricopeptide repeat protein